jgi:hypothetical protein
MPYLTVVVKQAHINNGYANVDDNDACVIALASQAAFKDKTVLCLFDSLGVGGKTIPLPKSAQDLQRRIYDGVPKKELKPFLFPREGLNDIRRRPFLAPRTRRAVRHNHRRDCAVGAVRCHRCPSTGLPRVAIEPA